MSAFRGDFLRRLPIPMSAAWLLSDIAEAKGRQSSIRAVPQVLGTLRETALVQSVESSNRIEGITVAPGRLLPLVLGDETPRDRSGTLLRPPAGRQTARDQGRNHSSLGEFTLQNLELAVLNPVSTDAPILVPRLSDAGQVESLGREQRSSRVAEKAGTSLPWPFLGESFAFEINEMNGDSQRGVRACSLLTAYVIFLILRAALNRLVVPMVAFEAPLSKELCAAVARRCRAKANRPRSRK